METTGTELDAARRLTIADVYTDKIFDARALNQPVWLKNSRHFSYLETAHDADVTTLWVYDLDTGDRNTVVPSQALKTSAIDPDEPAASRGAQAGESPEYLTIPGYQWSPDEKRVLFSHVPQWRSDEGDAALHVFDLATGRVTRYGGDTMRSAKWCSDSRRIGYVAADDVWILDVVSGIRTRLTNTAGPARYNGRLGWVYEEELDIVDGWSWSPDGRRVVYLQYDESMVPEVDIPEYGDLHLRPERTRYPKAGDPNPVVRVGVVDAPQIGAPAAGSPATRLIDLGADRDVLIARVQWTPDGKLLIQRMNRIQSRIDLLLADPASGASQVILTEQDPAWLDAPGVLTLIPGSDEFVWPSQRSGFRHLYLYSLSGKLERQLTHGSWDVDSVSGVDVEHRMLYFTAANVSPMERHICSTLLDSEGAVVQISDGSGTHAPLFSPDAQYYLDTYSARSTAPGVKLHHAAGHPVATVHENPMPGLAPHALGTWEFATFNTSDGVALNAALLKPAQFDASRKYPVLIYAYGGPGSQTVLDAWGSGGGLEQLVAQHGYVIAMVDGRGTGFRGREFAKVVYQNLGKWELNDHIEAARWLGGLPFVDSSRIGIWGWSYGGYLAALCATHGQGLFKAAVAVAPVTHWSLYDTIYTERYMRRPADNPKGYEDSSPLAFAADLASKLLLIHGTADDNVHFQNSARFAGALQKSGRQFEAMYYPDQKHGIEGSIGHLFTLFTDFITRNL
jgi:dipeptidyl-peptidase-4